MPDLHLDMPTTALILVDITTGMVGLAAHPDNGADVLRRAVTVADAFREASSLVVLTTNAGRPGGAAMRQRAAAAAGGAVVAPTRDLTVLMQAMATPGFGQLAPELGPQPNDHFIQKHTWSAFFSTDLDLQLRRLGIRTLVLGGITSNFGVESTARDGRAYGYDLLFVSDLMRALTKEEHEHSCGYSFPMMGRVTTSAEVLHTARAGTSL